MSFKFTEKAKPLLLSGIMLSVGLWSLPGSAQQVNDTKLNAFVEALRQAAPPNRPNDGMFSAWQVLPGIIPSWTKQCAGRQMTAAQFDADEATARTVVSCIMRRELKNQLSATGNNESAAVRRAACWWMTGKADGCQSGATATYVQRVMSFYRP